MNATQSVFQVKGVQAKAFSFCRLEMLPLHLRGCFNVGKSNTGCGGSAFPEDDSKSLIYLLMFLMSQEGQLAMYAFLIPFFFCLILFLGDFDPSHVLRVCLL